MLVIQTITPKLYIPTITQPKTPYPIRSIDNLTPPIRRFLPPSRQCHPQSPAPLLLSIFSCGPSPTAARKSGICTRTEIQNPAGCGDG